MKHQRGILILCSALLTAAVICTSCAPAGLPSGESASGVVTEAFSAPETPSGTVPETTESPEETAETKKEPTQTVTRYKIGEGTAEENEVVKIVSENPGPTVYIVGGIHGDELAGWYWTSTEFSATLAWGLYLGLGAMGNGPKASDRRRVRAVSAFIS